MIFNVFLAIAALPFALGQTITPTPVTSTVTHTTCPRSSRSHSRSHSRRHHDSDSDCERDHHDHRRPCHTSKWCPTSERCHTSKWCPPKPCCITKTHHTVISEKTCCVLVYPCPTNTTVMITSTSTVTVAPTSAAVAPVNLVVPVCVPCTSVVTETVRPSLVCTTMIFCDAADQSENCRLQNEVKIEEIASLALRDGGQVFVNGHLVVFEKRENNGKQAAKKAAKKASGQNANDASSVSGGVFGLVAVAAGAFLFAA